MEIIDVSVPVRPGMPIYAGNPGVCLALHSAITRGDSANVTRIDFGAHTGTHVDAPYHFYADASTAETLALDVLMGRCLVVDATWASGSLDAAAVARMDLPPGTERVLVRTENSWLWERPDFTRDFVRFDGSGARALVQAGVRLVGIDYLSVGNQEAHRILLGDADVVAVEGLDLRHVAPGAYELICLPLRLVGSDGAPARAVLVRR